MLEKLPFWGQVALALALAALIVAGVYFGYIQGMREEIAVLRADIEQLDAKIREGRAIEQKLPEFEREVANLQRKLGDIQQILPTGTETGGGALPDARAAASTRPNSQYQRAAEVPVPVSQYSVMLSRTWSRVRLPVSLPPMNAREIL